MDEHDLRTTEALLARAGAAPAAAVAFAAILRLGELGPEGAAAFARHCELATYDPDILDSFRAVLKRIVEALG